MFAGEGKTYVDLNQMTETAEMEGGLSSEKAERNPSYSLNQPPAPQLDPSRYLHFHLRPCQQ